MDDMTLARILHVVAILMWIGGVGFVTLVVIPAIRDQHPAPKRMIAFHRFEGRFAFQARIWVALAGFSGLWMTWRGAMWDRFLEGSFWWMHLMAMVWLVFAAMLFVVEPLFLHRRMEAADDTGQGFRRLARLHALLLAVSLAAVAGAVGGAHGLF